MKIRTKLNIVKAINDEGIIFSGLHSTSLGSKSILIDIHGLSWDFYSTSFYSLLFSDLVNEGIDFLAGETRGAYKLRNFETVEGSYLLSGGAYELFEQSISDIRAWIDFAENLGYESIYLSGYSYGPTKVANYYKITKDKRLKSLIFISPSDIYGLVHEPSELENHKRLIKESKDLIHNGKPLELLEGKLWSLETFSAQTYLSLFDNPDAYIFNYFNPELGFETLNLIDIPVLALTGKNDEGIVIEKDIFECMDTLKQNLPNSKEVRIKIFDGADHSFEGFEADLLREIVKYIQEN